MLRTRAASPRCAVGGLTEDSRLRSDLGSHLDVFRRNATRSALAPLPGWYKGYWWYSKGSKAHQGGTERRNKGYRRATRQGPVPPGHPSRYPMESRIVLRVPPGPTCTPSTEEKMNQVSIFFTAFHRCGDGTSAWLLIRELHLLGPMKNKADLTAGSLNGSP